MTYKYGIKYDPPIEAMSLDYRECPAPTRPRRHTLVGYSARGYGAHVERLTLSVGTTTETTTNRRLYAYDAEAEAKLKELADEYQRGLDKLAPILGQVNDILASLKKIEKPKPGG